MSTKLMSEVRAQEWHKDFISGRTCLHGCQRQRSGSSVAFFMNHTLGKLCTCKHFSPDVLALPFPLMTLKGLTIYLPVNYQLYFFPYFISHFPPAIYLSESFPLL